MQYLHRNYFLFHGLKEGKAEDTDSLIIDTVKEEIDNRNFLE